MGKTCVCLPEAQLRGSEGLQPPAKKLGPRLAMTSVRSSAVRTIIGRKTGGPKIGEKSLKFFQQSCSQDGLFDGG